VWAFARIPSASCRKPLVCFRVESATIPKISRAPAPVGKAAHQAQLQLGSSAESAGKAPVIDVSLELVTLLAPSVGQEKAVDSIAQAARAHSIKLPMVTRDQALAILDTLGTSPGLLGVAARVGKARFLLRRAT